MRAPTGRKTSVVVVWLYAVLAACPGMCAAAGVNPSRDRKEKTSNRR